MQTDALLVLSSVLVGISLTGVVMTLRGSAPAPGRHTLIVVFGLFLGLSALPLIARFARPVFDLYLPALLPCLLLLPACFFHYVTERIDAVDHRPWRRRHLGLPLIGVIVMIGYWALPGPVRRTLLIEGDLPEGWFPALLALTTFALILIWAVTSLIYLAVILKHLSRYRARLKALYSNTEAYELRWMDGFILMLVIGWSLAGLSVISDNLGPGLIVPAEGVVFTIGLAVLMLVVFATGQMPAQDIPPSLPPESDKYARSALSPERMEHIARKLETAMRAEALYLDPTLSLQKLAKHVAAPHNHVSQTLNGHLGTTFFDYVARWRVQAAQPLLLTEKASVLTIALDVGFNSRSTFYKAFKRETGLTPKAYQKHNAASA